MNITDLLQYLTAGVNVGFLGIVFWLFVGGKLHSSSEFEAVVRDRDMERTAHEHTREALRLASARSETGVLAAQIVAQAFSGRRVGEQNVAPQAQPDALP